MAFALNKCRLDRVTTPNLNPLPSSPLVQSTGLDELRSRISQNIVDYFPKLKGRPHSLQLAELSRRQYSTICFFELSESDHADGPMPGIAVKIFSEDDGETAKWQYSALKTIWPAFADGGPLSIPRPLDYFDDLPAVVMERVDGTSLQELFGLLTWLPQRSSEVVAACHASGRWLRRFHLTTRLDPASLDAVKKLKSAQTNLAELEKRGLPETLCHEILAALRYDACKLTDIRLEKAMVHGDFTVDNVLKNQDRCFVLDITGKDHNSIYHDLATFLNSLLLIGLSSPISLPVFGRCGESFLAGYFDNRSPDRTPLLFLQLTGLTNTVLQILTRQSHRPIIKLWACRFAAYLFRRLLLQREVNASGVN